MSYYRDNLPEILRKCKQLERRGFYIIRSRKVQVYKDYTFIVKFSYNILLKYSIDVLENIINQYIIK